MCIFAFDSLAYAKEMEAGGFTRQQSEAFAAAQGKILKDAFAASELATKTDIRDVRDEIQDVRAELKADIQDVRNEIQAVRTELKADIQDVRNEIQAVRAELKADIQDVRNEIQDVRNEVQDVRLDVQNVRLEVQDVRSEVKGVEMRLLRWQIGIGAAIVSFMLAGFGGIAAIMAKALEWRGF